MSDLENCEYFNTTKLKHVLYSLVWENWNLTCLTTNGGLLTSLQGDPGREPGRSAVPTFSKVL